MFKKVTALLAEKAAHAQTTTAARREFLKRTLGAVAVAAVTPALATTAACGDDDDDATGTDGTGDDDDSTNTTGSTTDGGTTDGSGTETTGGTTDGGTTDGSGTETTGGTTDGSTTDGSGTETDGSTTDGSATETDGGAELPATAQKFGAADSVQTGTLAKFPSARMIVGRDAAGYYAFTSICTHLRCDTSKNFGTIDGDSLTCTCHNSTFDKDGKNTGGPAKSPLANKKVYIVGGELYVDPAEDVPAGTRTAA